ncbi:hypothetical protein AABM06_09965 [Listeria ivanovii]|uniref:Uncharacterized protein n=1 Tax=Listeria ivanovii (strain ATCC BAA-678 / PAM 55) TaxID=881621 RepID=G2Z891_LISIP|nr:hypothetical protein [Listeria ivanovii]MBC1760048.1 hypothetical protein [Listeria ivanovii]MBK3914556.1 hypothetical protein [Listeria ivanovii subsp. ivanovii]MBK3921546.1 hypothetical protein [Listeria ivanovii subsp. ivanovii]MBK3926710.1 hypothetical protein [Listeria ivanovii subsp. ivanovii]MCJ1717582.1 hypothetical protein [Listeria ivanovii]
MKKYPLIVIFLLVLVGIGLLMGDFKSFFILAVSLLIGTIIFTLIFRLLSNKKTDSNYQKAVKQSKNLHADKKKTKKKRKSSFKVIDGGKK